MNTPPLPSSLDAERSVLGAILLDNRALMEIASYLHVDEFFLSEHRLIFKTICELAKKEVASGRPLRSSGSIDLVTLTEALHTEGQLDNAGGAPYLASLADSTPRVSNIKHYATIIREKAVLRNIANASESMTRAALEPHAKAEDVSRLAHALSISLSAWSSDGGLGVLASEISPERVEWLWFGRIPLGKVTVLDGDPGVGKSALTLDLAARITTGRPMPDGSADTIVPRLSAMGANLKRVRILKTLLRSEGERQPEIPGDLADIERTAELVKARLIVIDPLMAFLASETNSFRDQDVRRALAPLATTAERLRSAVVIVRHLNKNSEGNPIYRGGGSIGIIGAARGGLLVALDPDDESRQSRILAVTKTNLGPGVPSLRWSIQPDDRGVVRVHWSGESTHQAITLLAHPDGEEGRTESGEAGDYLLAVLEDGPLPANEVLRKGKAAGFSERTLKRAKAKIRVKRLKQGFGPGATWLWELPAKDAKSASNSASNPEVAPFAQTLGSKPIESDASPKRASDTGMAPFDKNAARFASGNGAGERVRVVSWNLPEEPIHIEGVGRVMNPTLFANSTLQQLRGALENPKRKAAWSVSQLIYQLSQVGVDVELSD